MIAPIAALRDHWSHALLTGPEQAILRRASVFATPVHRGSGREAAGRLGAGRPPSRSPPGSPGSPSTACWSSSRAGLAPGTAPGDDPPVRAERLREAGRAAQAHARHLRWCLAEADGIGRGHWPRTARGGVRTFDRLDDELRAALDWAAGQPDHPSARGVPSSRSALAELSFARGLPGEAQRRYEQAAALAAGDRRPRRRCTSRPWRRRPGTSAAMRSRLQPRLRRRRAPGR